MKRNRMKWNPDIKRAVTAIMIGFMALVIGFGLGWAGCLSYGMEKAQANLEETPISEQDQDVRIVELVQNAELIGQVENLRAEKEPDLILAEDILPEAPSIPGKLLTDDELDMVCGMVMGEGAGREMYIAIAQCMKNAMEIYDWTAAETIEQLYGTPRTEWSPLVEDVVTGVFYEGLAVTDEPILFYYAEDLCESPWHESRPFVMQIRNTRFFK